MKKVLRNKDEDKYMAIEDDVIAAIKTGRAKMRPRSYFAFRNALNILGSVIILLVAIYIVGFIIFVVRERGALYETTFGPEGWRAFFASLPWALIALFTVFFAVIAVLTRKYPFAYRLPALYSVVGLILLIITGNIFLAQTSLYGTLFDPPSAYNIFTLPIPSNVYRGMVTEPTSSGFIMTDAYGTTSTVTIASTTYLPSGGNFGFGDAVVVLGDRNELGVIPALGVKKIGD